MKDGFDALCWIDQDLSALAVLDLHLLRVWGRDVLRELQSHGPTSNIPVVVVTGIDTIPR